MMRRTVFAAAVATAALCGSQVALAGAAAAAKQPTALGTGGAAASVDPLATRAAISVLRRGGNAADAAIAAASVLGVVEPYSCGVGGGGFMVIRDGLTGRITTVDSREKAPAAIRPDSFFINGQPPTDAQFPINRYSGLSVGVPGTPAAWRYVLRHFGTWRLRDVLRYGERVAQRGFKVDTTFFNQTQPNDDYFDDVPSTAKIYLDPDGTPRDVGTTIRNPDLAKTYARMGRLGVIRGFYRGAVARAIVKAAQHPPLSPTANHTWRPGLMTLADLRHYRIKERRPVHVNYRGRAVYGMGPPSSGGTTVEEALNILKTFDPRVATRTEMLYGYLEASRLAYADRNAYLADPAFFNVPVAGLLSNSYGRERAAKIPPTAPQGPVPAGDPYDNQGSAARVTVSHPGESTTHLSVADAYGDVVAYTFTIEQTGGDGIVVPGWGFLLNNELTDFNTSSTTDANRAQGNKRPRSSISPTIVLRNGRPWLTVGSPGGASIITTVLQILVNRIDFHDSLPTAIAKPRASQRNSATTEAESAFQNSPEGQVLESEYGERYRLPSGDEIGAATGIEFKRHHVMLAAAEPVRRGGGSAGVVRRRR